MNDLCVVFDIDDTLYLERDYVLSGFAALGPWVKAWRGIPDFTERCAEAFHGGVRGSIFNHVLGDEASQDLVQTLVTLYRCHTPEIRLCDDAHAALTEASARWPVAAITDGPAISQTRKAEALGLQRFVSPIIVTELLGRECSKPNPVAFRKAEQAMPAKRYVYVADNPAKDFNAPRQLGWNSVRIRRPGGLHFKAEASEALPDVEFHDCTRLVAWLSELT